MTDDQLSALCGVLQVAAQLNRPVEPHVMFQALRVVDAYHKARTAYRQCSGRHMRNCNSRMGWGENNECDCPHNTLRATLLNGGGS